MNSTRNSFIKKLFCLSALGISVVTTTLGYSEAVFTASVDTETGRDFTFSSSDRKTDTVVLFTSQGCSSCPPAEEWLNSYSSDPKLWTDRIPLAFHVDYWDYLGWKDPFARKTFSRLQRDYARQGHFASVYTPGIAVNNREFRQWFYGQRQWAPSDERPGVLTVEVTEELFKAGFQPNTQLSSMEFDVHSAWLGMGITTKVTAGENRGRKLAHDFVVLDYKNHGASLDQERPLETAPELGQSSSVMVVWITPRNSTEILQAAAYPI